MRVKFVVNLGSRDAESLELDYRQCHAGAVVDVTREVADKLRGTATADFFEAATEVKAKPEK